eukprot:9478960-Pyramimonas_sp.AAC.1
MEAMRESWRVRNIHRAFFHARAAAGVRMGPKKRKFLEIRTALPTRKEQLDFWALPGPEGGMAAREVGEWEGLPPVCSAVPYDAQVFEQAGEDMKRVRRQLRKVQKRR